MHEGENTPVHLGTRAPYIKKLIIRKKPKKFQTFFRMKDNQVLHSYKKIAMKSLALHLGLKKLT
jgi:hypothetical protein